VFLPPHFRQRHVLLAAEVAISVVVVITSALLLEVRGVV